MSKTSTQSSRREVVFGTSCTLTGIASIIVGILFLIAAGYVAPDGVWGAFPLMLCAGALLVAGGIALIQVPRLRAALRAAQVVAAPPEPTDSAPKATAPAAPQAATQAVPPSMPQPAEVVSREPFAPSVQKATSGDMPHDPIEEVTSLVLRSHDVLATLQDLVRHEEHGEGAHRYLSELLEATGLMDWEDAPRCELGLLGRNRHFWMRLHTDELDDDTYDRLISIEAALNVSKDLGRACAYRTREEAARRIEQLLLGLTRQRLASYDFAPSLEMAYPGVAYEDTPGEWYVRAGFASAAECAVTPFRVVHDHRSCVEAGLLVISLEIPRPQCMVVLTPDESEQVAFARDYALRLATLLAEQALGISRKLDTVVVNCHERESAKTILSVRYTSAVLGQLVPLLESTLVRGPLPEHPAIRAHLAADGWFEPVEPFLELEAEEVSPRARFVYPELDHRPTSERLQALTGARRVDELGINESAGRLAVRDELAIRTWRSTEDAVGDLVRLRDTAEDITVAEGANRLIEALLSGGLDASDTDAALQLFMGGTTLERAVERAEALLERDDEADPLSAVSILTEALSPIQTLGAYFDDPATVYRYFGSVAERIRYELELDDHKRVVQLVPDAYFNALSGLSSAYDMLGETDRALEAAEEMLRIAPVSIGAAMRKVRILEGATRIFEAADLIRKVLHYASTPRDAAICQYRLAFMEWRLGREDLAVACYTRALAWDTEMSYQAREELDDLLAQNENLQRLSLSEANEVLKREGIPLGCEEDVLRRTLATAVLACDEGIFWVARPLVGILFGVGGDDVLMGIYRSLVPNA